MALMRTAAHPRANCEVHPTTRSAQAASREATTGREGLIPPRVRPQAVQASVPLYSHSRGIPGQLAVSDRFLYVCVARNSWRRTPVASLTAYGVVHLGDPVRHGGSDVIHPN
jgi:hypothetical protein